METLGTYLLLPLAVIGIVFLVLIPRDLWAEGLKDIKNALRK